jgi:hypothetical protein
MISLSIDIHKKPRKFLGKAFVSLPMILPKASSFSRTYFYSSACLEKVFKLYKSLPTLVYHTEPE